MPMSEQLRAVRRIFLGLDCPFIRRIDASRPPEEVWQECRGHIERLIL